VAEQLKQLDCRRFDRTFAAHMASVLRVELSGPSPIFKDMSGGAGRGRKLIGRNLLGGASTIWRVARKSNFDFYWTYFHCPGTTLFKDMSGGAGRGRKLIGRNLLGGASTIWRVARKSNFDFYWTYFMILNFQPNFR